MRMEEKLMVKNKKYELVPPDGGYGYFISIAAIINYSTTTSLIGSFGIIFDGFMKELGMNSTTVTLLTGIAAMGTAIAGLFTSALLKVMSKRKLALLAALSFDLGVLGTAFVKSVIPFFICQGIMQGIGMGILYSLSCTIINDYFLKKRLFAVSFVQTITAITAMVAPMFVKWCLDEYGFRGTLFIITGISFQNLWAVALMQPVEWHMKRVEIATQTEMQALVENKSNVNKPEIPTVKLTDVEEAFDPSIEKDTQFPGDPSKSTGLKKFVEAILDLSICKKMLLSCVGIGPALCVFADATYALILPQALYAMDWDQNKVALAIAVYGFGDLTARTLLMIGSKWLLNIGNQEIYIFGLVMAFMSRIGMLCSTSSTAILIYIFLMGTAHCTICVLIALVVSEVVSPDKFTSAIGIVLMLIGVANLILGPAIGAVRDLTNSYSAAFYLLTSCYTIIILFWSIELLYKKNKHKRMPRNNSKKNSPPFIK